MRHESQLDVAQIVLTGYDDSGFPLQAATPVQQRRILQVLRLASSPRSAWVLTSHRRSDAPAHLTHVARIAHGSIVSITDLRAGAVDSSVSELQARAEVAPAPRRKVQDASAGVRITRGVKPLLRLQRAAVYRDEQRVIGMFDWTLERGQHWWLLGANGAGKSTFIAMLYGDLWPAHGGMRERQ